MKRACGRPCASNCTSGYLTLEAENGEQALNMLDASPDIGMFISDLMLPGGLSGAGGDRPCAQPLSAGAADQRTGFTPGA